MEEGDLVKEKRGPARGGRKPLFPGPDLATAEVSWDSSGSGSVGSVDDAFPSARFLELPEKYASEESCNEEVVNPLSVPVCDVVGGNMILKYIKKNARLWKPLIIKASSFEQGVALIRSSDVFVVLFPEEKKRKYVNFMRRKEDRLDTLFPWVRSWYTHVHGHPMEFIRADFLVSFMETVAMMGVSEQAEAILEYVKKKKQRLLLAEQGEKEKFPVMRIPGIYVNLNLGVDSGDSGEDNGGGKDSWKKRSEVKSFNHMKNMLNGTTEDDFLGGEMVLRMLRDLIPSEKTIGVYIDESAPLNERVRYYVKAVDVFGCLYGFEKAGQTKIQCYWTFPEILDHFYCKIVVNGAREYDFVAVARLAEFVQGVYEMDLNCEGAAGIWQKLRKSDFSMKKEHSLQFLTQERSCNHSQTGIQQQQLFDTTRPLPDYESDNYEPKWKAMAEDAFGPLDRDWWEKSTQWPSQIGVCSSGVQTENSITSGVAVVRQQPLGGRSDLYRNTDQFPLKVFKIIKMLEKTHYKHRLKFYYEVSVTAAKDPGTKPYLNLNDVFMALFPMSRYATRNFASMTVEKQEELRNSRGFDMSVLFRHEAGHLFERRRFLDTGLTKMRAIYARNLPALMRVVAQKHRSCLVARAIVDPVYRRETINFHSVNPGFRVQFSGNYICLPDLVIAIFDSRKFGDALQLCETYLAAFVEREFPFFILKSKKPNDNRKHHMPCSSMSRAIELMYKLPDSKLYEKEIQESKRIIERFMAKGRTAVSKPVAVVEEDSRSVRRRTSSRLAGRDI